jgi:uncharacterized protein YwqG
LNNDYNGGHKIGGYSYFTQSDPREEANNDVSVLQIDSIDSIMIGDCGVINFFIDKTDLKNKDFAKV